MITPDQYVLPHKERKQQRTPEEEAKAAETLAWLQALPWRPHGMEW
jgi:hypothetical protein